MNDLSQHSPANGSRRAVLGAAGVGTLSALLFGWPRRGPAPAGKRADASRLRPATDAATGLPLIRLHEGFSYTSFGWTGDVMDDGRRTPDRHDGMAVVAERDGRLILIRNHERLGDDGAFGPRELAYDTAATGGTTNLCFDPQQGRLLQSWVSLSGTLINCAGGPTPWGSWLSCEECVLDSGHSHPVAGRALGHLQRPHGFVFEVGAEGVSPGVPLPGLGRFRHEAAAVDALTGDVYLTEDHHPAGFYRFRPKRAGDLAAGGDLQMMRVAGRQSMRDGHRAAARYAVDWVPIGDPSRGHQNARAADGHGVLSQGMAQGGARFSRLEGCWAEDGQVVFVSTDGGDAGFGQIWRYEPASEVLELVFESPGPALLNRPDNLCPAPFGGLILCEDASGGPSRLLWRSMQGQLRVLAESAVRLAGERNGLAGDHRGSEWAGACFSPDGRWLFVNLQQPGITLAITGPWPQLADA